MPSSPLPPAPGTPPDRSPAREGQTCWGSDLRCPRCGCTLNTNGRLVWCSFVGSQRPGGERACRYGLDGDVTYDEALASLPGATPP